jgi:uncharacterized RDD family membrane protein YckC
VTGVRCPRCHRDAPELTAFCAGCGAPLLLRDEDPGGPVDAPVVLDRRSRGAGETPRAAAPRVELPGPAATFPPRGPVPHAEELADVEKSHWDLGPIAAAADLKREPVPSATGGARNEARNVVAPPKPSPSARATSTPTTTSTSTANSTATATSTSTSTSAAAATATATATATGTTTRLPPLDDLPEPEVDALEVHVARAEPWRRAVAWVVDVIPFLAAGGALGFFLLREVAAARGGPPRSLDEVVELVSAERVIALSVVGAVVLALATYATLAHALGGATLGKRLVRIRVVGPDGGPPSPARSAIRSLLAVISAALLGLGFLLALFTRTGRALHDVLARTWVVKAP